MTTRPRTALVLMSDSPLYQARVAGLSIGERLMLALSFGGIERVAFIGGGRLPHSSRASVTVLPPKEVTFADGETFVLLPSDLVFDRGLLSAPDHIPEGSAVQVLSGDLFPKVCASPEVWLAKLGAGRADSSRGFALRVTDRDTAKRASNVLFRSLVKPVDGFISRHLNRKISVFCTRFLIRTSLHPNQLTGMILLLGLLSGVAAYFAEYWWSLALAGFLFQAQSVLDGCDGEIARLKYQFSRSGQWLDSVGDDITNYSFCLGLALGQARVLGLDWMNWVAWGILLVQVYASALMYQRIYKMNTGDLLAIPNMVSGGEATGIAGRIVRLLHTITKRDFFVFVTSVLTAVGFPFTAFALIAGGSLVLAPSLTLNEFRIRRAIRNGTLTL